MTSEKTHLHDGAGGNDAYITVIYTMNAYNFMQAKVDILSQASCRMACALGPWVLVWPRTPPPFQTVLWLEKIGGIPQPLKLSWLQLQAKWWPLEIHVLCPWRGHGNVIFMLIAVASAFII